MFEKYKSLINQGKEYALLSQVEDLPTPVGTLDVGISYKDYVERSVKKDELREKFDSYNFLEKFIFETVKKSHMGKNKENWKIKGETRHKLLENLVLENNLIQDIYSWDEKVSPINYQEEAEYKNDLEGIYGGYIKDWRVVLTSDDYLEASIDVGRVSDPELAREDFKKLFISHGWELVKTPNSFLPEKTFDLENMYFFTKEKKVVKH